MDNRNNTKRNIVTVILLSVVVVGGFYFFAGDEGFTRDENSFFPTPKLSVEPGRTVLEGQRLYENDQFGFSFVYSETMTIREVEEGAGAWTYIFQNEDKAEGFQIFIVPYDEETITDERFLRDVPSGVRENIEDVEIDSILAVAFDSQDFFLGKTKEVWLIRGGYLYEFTTFRTQALLLSDTLKTVVFTDYDYEEPQEPIDVTQFFDE